MVGNTEKINLPVLQNWDCHVCGTCCKEYLVRLSEDEVQKIISQNWDIEMNLMVINPLKKLVYLKKLTI